MQRLEEHESLQMAMLQWLGSKRLLGLLAFGEGSMLRLCHELPRYSRDMYFWFFKEEDYEDFYNRLHGALSRDHNVTDAKNDHSSILLKISAQKRMSGLKIEIRKNVTPVGSTEEKIAFSPHFPTQVLVRGFTLRHMLKNKISTLIDHGEIQDAFDLEFLVRKGIALNISEEQKRKVVVRLKGFKKRDFDVKLCSSLLQPELKDYYRQQRFAYLEEKLSFRKYLRDYDSKGDK